MNAPTTTSSSNGELPKRTKRKIYILLTAKGVCARRTQGRGEKTLRSGAAWSDSLYRCVSLHAAPCFSRAERKNMKQPINQTDVNDFVEIDPDADVSGLQPSELTEGKVFIISTDANGKPVTAEKRKSKTGGEFTQYTLHLRDENNQKHRLSYLFTRHLAPIARRWGKNTEAWHEAAVKITGFQNGQYWDVKIEAA